MFGSSVKLEKSGSGIKQSSWGEVEDYLLIEIKKRLLLYTDQVRFHGVCKNWFAVNQYNTIPLLPWIIDIVKSEHRFVCKLYESSANPSTPTFVYTINLNGYDISIHKYGWLFCTPSDQWSACINFLLFSPFTNKSIRLPPCFWSKPFLSTFSVDPNSPDCVFLLVYDGTPLKRITIKTFCHTYKYWRSRDFDRPENFGLSGNFPVYIRGTFYFVFPVGKLASYNVDRDEWKVEYVIGNDIFPEEMRDCWDYRYCIYEAFELNEELILICFTWNDKGFLARLDWSKKAWVPMESLGNHSLFCSEQSILVSQIGTEERKKGVLPNKIYYRKIYYGGSECLVYSLESGHLTEFMSESGIRIWDGTSTNYSYSGRRSTYYEGHWFEPPHQPKEKPSWSFRRKNDSEKSVSPILPKQLPNSTDTDIVNEMRNLEMDQTGEQSIDEQNDDELESLIILDQMRRSRNSAKDDNTLSIKLSDTGKKGILRRTSKR